MSSGDNSIQQLVEDIRKEIPALYRVAEGIAVLDMVCWSLESDDDSAALDLTIICTASVLCPAMHRSGLR